MNSYLQLLLVLDQVHVLVITVLVTWRHRIRVSARGRTRVLAITGGPRRHRQQQLRSRLLHALIHTVNTVHGRAAGAKIRQEEERAEAHDAERQEYQENQVLLARTEGPSREQRHRHTVREALVRRQRTGRRGHLTANTRHPCNAPRHLITTPVLRIRENSSTRARFARAVSAVIRHYECEHHLRATVDIATAGDRSADQLTWRARETAPRDRGVTYVRAGNTGI